MKYPHISRKEIEEAVRYSNESNCGFDTFKGMTVDQAIKKWADKAYSDDTTLDKTLMAYRANQDLVHDKDSIDVINKLLNDRRLRKKIRIIHDGSYYVNRIWVHVNAGGKVQFTPELCTWFLNIDDEKFDKLSAKKKVNWLYNHFDVIYIQVSPVESRNDIYEFILRDYRRYENLRIYPPMLMI